MHRVVKGLQWARVGGGDGPNHPIRRARGAKAMGLRYERGLAKALPEARHGVWFEFFDASGHGWCQPDFLLASEMGLVILESKYTWVAEGHTQIDWLYRPVVEMALGIPALGIVVCKNLTPSSPKTHSDLNSAIAAAVGPRQSVLHWLGNVPLFLTPAKSSLLVGA